MINKNKEEIEKILKGCREETLFIKKIDDSFNKQYYKCGDTERGELPCLCSTCKRAKQERIKTSILWCEDEIKKLELKYKWTNEIRNRINYFYLQTDKTLKFPDGQIHQLCKMMMDLDDKIEFEIKQLQTHLTWLKEQEKKQ